MCACVCVCIPAYVVDQAGLQQQISSWQKVVTDQVLVGAHCHAVTYTQRTQHIQNLDRKYVSAVNIALLQYDNTHTNIY